MKEKTFSIQTTSKILQFPLGGERKFFQWLRDKGYLLKGNEPAQKYIDSGVFILALIKIKKGQTTLILTVPRVTIKGLSILNEMVKKDFPICKPCADAN